MLEVLASSSAQIIIAVILTGLVFFGFIREILPSDVIALIAMGVLMLTGILSVDETLGVFSNGAPITIAALFVVSAALESTGVIDQLGFQIERLAKSWPLPLALLVMVLGVTALSAFLNNTPVVVILIPVVIRLAKTIGVPASKLLMPLSFAAVMGGTVTLIGSSTNLIINGVVQDYDLPGIGMFEFTGAGMLMALAGALFLFIAGPFLIPQRDTLAGMLPDQSQRRFIAQILVPIDSVLVGKPVSETGFTAARGFTVIDVFRDGESLQRDLNSVVLKGGDRIVLRTGVSEMLTLKELGHIAIGADAVEHAAFEPVQSSEMVMAEGVIGPGSRLIGRRFAGLGLSRLYGVYALAIHRRGENMRARLKDIRLDVGDTVLVEGPATGMRRVFEDGLLNNLTAVSEQPVRRDKAWIALLALFSVVIFAALNVLPIEALALMAAAAVVAFGCIDHQEAYRAIRWDILMLIFGMIAIGMALEKTGAIRMLVEAISGPLAQAGPLAVLTVIYLVTLLLTEFLSNNATAILITPIAIALAQQMGIDPRALIMAVLFASSSAFAVPMGYQTHLLVYTAGGYRFTDFLRVGLPLDVLLFAVAMVVIPMFWPL
jgi:di/tricarboxylate transporter